MKAGYVLVLNCGSSSIKFAVMDPHAEETVISGIVQCIGMVDANLSFKYRDEKTEKELPNIDYQSALKEIVHVLETIKGLIQEIIAVGHRVVHGGEKFTKSALITDQILNEIQICANLAPLHNPANLIGIKVAKEFFPKLPQIAVFDTAFHQTMPKHAYLYAIQLWLYEKYAIRRYGFHGTSHLYVSHKAAEMLDKPIENSAFITAHLGNGCSVAAVLNGKSMDTSMGLTPLEGLVMGTRSGDVDPSLHEFLTNTLGYDIHKVTKLLNKQSGLLGISGISSDMRAIEDAALEGDEHAILAEDIFSYRLAKYIMSYTVPLRRLDALIFTGGIGENGFVIREKVLRWLGILGFELDEEKNNANGKQSNGIITKEGSPIAMVVPTNEELVIARDAAVLAHE